MALLPHKYHVLSLIYKYMSLGSLSHAKIKNLIMGRHKKTKKIGERRLKEETKWRAILLKKEGKLSNRQIAVCCKEARPKRHWTADHWLKVMPTMKLQDGRQSFILYAR